MICSFFINFLSTEINPQLPVMSPGKVDPAILEALGADASQASLTTSGFGSGFASTSKLTLTIDGEEKEFFVKIASGANAPAMLEGNAYPLLLSLLVAFISHKEEEKLTCSHRRVPLSQSYK